MLNQSKIISIGTLFGYLLGSEVHAQQTSLFTLPCSPSGKEYSLKKVSETEGSTSSVTVAKSSNGDAWNPDAEDVSVTCSANKCQIQLPRLNENEKYEFSTNLSFIGTSTPLATESVTPTSSPTHYPSANEHSTSSPTSIPPTEISSFSPSLSPSTERPSTTTPTSSSPTKTPTSSPSVTSGPSVSLKFLINVQSACWSQGAINYLDSPETCQLECTLKPNCKSFSYHHDRSSKTCHLCGSETPRETNISCPEGEICVTWGLRDDSLIAPTSSPNESSPVTKEPSLSTPVSSSPTKTPVSSPSIFPSTEEPFTSSPTSAPEAPSTSSPTRSVTSGPSVSSSFLINVQSACWGLGAINYLDSPETCQLECTRHPSCKTFSYHHDRSSKTCHLCGSENPRETNISCPEGEICVTWGKRDDSLIAPTSTPNESSPVTKEPSLSTPASSSPTKTPVSSPPIFLSTETPSTSSPTVIVTSGPSVSSSFLINKQSACWTQGAIDYLDSPETCQLECTLKPHCKSFSYHHDRSNKRCHLCGSENPRETSVSCAEGEICVTWGLRDDNLIVR